MEFFFNIPSSSGLRNVRKVAAKFDTYVLPYHIVYNRTQFILNAAINNKAAHSISEIQDGLLLAFFCLLSLFFQPLFKDSQLHKN
jgi:hypothetical protein